MDYKLGQTCNIARYIAYNPLFVSEDMQLFAYFRSNRNRLLESVSFEPCEINNYWWQIYYWYCCTRGLMKPVYECRFKIHVSKLRCKSRGGKNYEAVEGLLASFFMVVVLPFSKLKYQVCAIFRV